ncbi:MAG: site-specific DNA-methyltransferase [Fusobacteria bacterium]|nr:site-specific DNA-methyltransferase [Fusobacteriota bacterium]
MLKLLQKSYHGKVKMIYIDPPYNTGKDFVYPDKFHDSLANYKQITGQVDGDGNRVSTNSESSGRYHTDWLNMMYPRLTLARNLLRDDGVIFISIDDNEVANSRKMCDEIFEESNFIANFIVVRSEGGGLAKQAVIGHDYLLCYSKNNINFIPLKKPKDIRGKVVIINNEEYWIEDDWLRKEFGKYGTCPYNEIEKYYDFNKKITIDKGIEEGKYQLIEKNGVILVGRLRKISEDGSKFYTIMKHLNKNGVKDLQELDLETIFDFPKPVSLLFSIIQGSTFSSSINEDIILDFNSGSATTAHAVMQLNSEDGGNRKFILVQLPEPCDESSEAFKAGYKNICEIGKERIRRAGKKILEERSLGNAQGDKKSIVISTEAEKSTLLKEEMKDVSTTLDMTPNGVVQGDNNNDMTKKLDIGFKVLKLDSSNIKEWDPLCHEDLENQLLFSVDNIKQERTAEDVLYEIFIKYGLELTVPWRVEKSGEKHFFVVGAGNLIVCL